MSLALEQHRRIRVRGDDLGQHARPVLQIRPFREERHAPGVLPWYRLRVDPRIGHPSEAGGTRILISVVVVD